ncbi:MAG: 16S rRNA (cytosine(1402)-N(4))-methyltransferase RsmH [Anaerofustis sp.]
MDDQQNHKRRVRYAGTHPKTYNEKYKELQPEKYADTVAKVIGKGNTPAGMHRSICVEEIMEILAIRDGETGLDATLGYGGHTAEMAKRLEGKGHLYATDVDPIELPRTKERLAALGFGEEILSIRQMNFSEIDALAKEVGGFDFVLADLGVSSMQIDNPERGFTFKQEGPLDLRLNPEEGISAAERLREISYYDLVQMLTENADEPHAEQIARAIASARKKGVEIATTTQLREIIAEALSFLPKREQKTEIKKACQRCFQALRIDVNGEFDALRASLEKLPDALKPGGRVAILSFHSGEDRLVKKSFQQYVREGVYASVSDGPILPSAEECGANPRARSAKLRWAVKG